MEVGLAKSMNLELSKDFMSQGMDIDIVKKQNNFLDSKFMNILNTSLDIGIKALLPDFIENTVIDVKDSLMQEGIKAGINTMLNGFRDIGKSIVGVFTGKFDNINQMDIATKQGGIIKTFSKLLSTGIGMSVSKGLISPELGTILKNGKTVILSSFSNNLEGNIEKQFKSFEKLEKQINNWEINYKSQDLTKMKRNYINIMNLKKEIIPFQELMDKTKKINVMHNWIEKNKSFNLPKEMIDLISKI